MLGLFDQITMRAIHPTLVDHTKPVTSDEEYSLLLAVSKDSLAILTKDRHFVTWLICGDDNYAILLTSDSEDDFLDAISMIRTMIKNQQNPKQYLLDNYET